MVTYEHRDPGGESVGRPAFVGASLMTSASGADSTTSPRFLYASVAPSGSMIPWSSHLPDDSTIPLAAPAVNSESAGHEQGTHNPLVGGSSPPRPTSKSAVNGRPSIGVVLHEIECALLALDWTRVGESLDADRGSMSLRGG